MALSKRGYNSYKAGKLIKSFLDYEQDEPQDSIRTIKSIKKPETFFFTQRIVFNSSKCSLRDKARESRAKEKD
jgi:hypothetical protein